MGNSLFCVVIMIFSFGATTWKECYDNDNDMVTSTTTSTWAPSTVPSSSPSTSLMPSTQPSTSSQPTTTLSKCIQVNTNVNESDDVIGDVQFTCNDCAGSAIEPRHGTDHCVLRATNELLCEQTTEETLIVCCVDAVYPEDDGMTVYLDDGGGSTTFAVDIIQITNDVDGRNLNFCSNIEGSCAEVNSSTVTCTGGSCAFYSFLSI